MRQQKNALSLILSKSLAKPIPVSLGLGHWGELGCRVTHIHPQLSAITPCDAHGIVQEGDLECGGAEEARGLQRLRQCRHRKRRQRVENGRSLQLSVRVFKDNLQS